MHTHLYITTYTYTHTYGYIHTQTHTHLAGSFSRLSPGINAPMEATPPLPLAFGHCKRTMQQQQEAGKRSSKERSRREVGQGATYGSQSCVEPPLCLLSGAHCWPFFCAVCCSVQPALHCCCTSIPLPTCCRNVATWRVHSSLATCRLMPACLPDCHLPCNEFAILFYLFAQRFVSLANRKARS